MCKLTPAPLAIATSALIALAALAAPTAPAPPAASPGLIVLTLRPEAVVQQPQVLVGDVVTLEGGSFLDRRRIGGLDLTDRPGTGQDRVVSRDQVMYRILLAGVEGHRFRVEGSPAVRISSEAK